MLHHAFRSCIALTAVALMLGGCQSNKPLTPDSGTSLYQASDVKKSDSAQADSKSDRNLPTLVVTNDPPPDVIYRRGSRDTVLAGRDTSIANSLPSFDTQHVETIVTRKVAELNKDIANLKRSTEGYQERLQSLQQKSDTEAAEYYTLVAGINAELQSGTTAGNPVLIERWNVAQGKLTNLAESEAYLNQLVTDLTNEASKAAYLQESIRATYGLSGAVEEDHAKLRVAEDNVNQDIVELNRLLTSTSDEIKRRDTYLRSERLNMQTLSLAIANGELYGQSMTNSLFKKATEDGQEIFKADPSANGSTLPPQRRPLVIIRFDRANVDYQQAVYTAVGQALEKYPSAKFELVAVSPAAGNAAELALASTEARKNGEAVLRSLMQMGLPMERVRLSAANSKDVRNSEVHLYIQ